MDICILRKRKNGHRLPLRVMQKVSEISLGGGMGTSFGEGMILCAGGVDKDIFLKALQGIYAGKRIFVTSCRVVSV